MVEGRLKDQIIRGGEINYPRELEELLFEYPAVAEVAVIGLPDERLGEIAYVREHLSLQKTLACWFELEEFPLTGSGKIQKFVLRTQWLDGKYAEMS